MTIDVRERLGGADGGRLREVVRAVVGDDGAAIGNWSVTPLHGGFGALAGGNALALIAGTARVGSTERPWRVVLKIVAPAADRDDPGQIQYARREALLYRSGVLADLPPGLRAPRCYGCDAQSDGTDWLWLEYVQEDGESVWPIERWALAARHLGQLNGAYLAEPAASRSGGSDRATDRSPRPRPLPEAPWLGGGRLRSWLGRHVPLVARIAGARHDPDLRHWWPGPVVDEILRLWDERDVFCDALERLPQTFCHGDAIRRNLLGRRGADGAAETVGIDWEFAGYMAAGEEVGQTLSVAGAFFQIEVAALPALDAALFAGYLAGLRDAGWRGDESLVRFAYVAHAALRNLFNAVGASRPDAARGAATLRSQGRSWEELAERRAAVRPFLLARAAEARQRLAAL